MLTTAPVEFELPRPKRGRPAKNTPATTAPDPVIPEAEIQAANRRHDRMYGFSYANSSLYLNPFRNPESVLGRLPWDTCS